MEAGTGPARPREKPHPSRSSLRGLDGLVFFVADLQTGFGPFVAVYLTSQAWTQVDIGLVLTVGGLIALIGQMPGGALVDAVRSERMLATMSVVAICASALAIAAWPTFAVVLGARGLQAAASCVLGPAIVAISLGLVGHAAIGERLGRNARFASIGNGLAAAAMGACGMLFSSRAVFFFTAAFILPTLIAIRSIRADEIDPVRAHGGIPKEKPAAVSGMVKLAGNRPLLVFAACLALFHLSNAAMLPLTASIVTMRTSGWATTLIAACIIVPQLIVAAISPWVGRRAQRWGRRPLLLIGLAALPIRGVLLAVVSDPYLLVTIQALDGITAAVLGVLVPLIVADVTRGTGRFNFAQGVVGSAVGVGASVSPTFAGYVTDHAGSPAAFLSLAAIGALALAAAYVTMPETRPQPESE